MRLLFKIATLSVASFVATSAHAQSWSNQASMKLKRSEASAADYNGELYVFNGFSRGLTVGESVEKYNPGSKSWSNLGSTSVGKGTGVTHTGTVVVGSDVWLLGGRVGSHPGRVTSDVWIYNIPSKQWRKGPKLPRPMAGGGAALVNNKIYMFGGIDALARCDVNYNYEYDLNSPNSGWKNITGSAGMPSARNHFATVVLNNKIYAIGGQHGHDGCPGIRGGNVALVHSFNPANKQWTRLANLPKADSHNEPSTFVHNGFIYSVGGSGDGNKVIRFDPAKNKWERIASLPEKLLAPVARIYNGRLVVGGGGAPITEKSIVKVRSLGSNKFNDVASGASPSQAAPAPEPVAPKPVPVQVSEPTPEPASAPEPAPTPKPEPTPTPATASESAASSIKVTGTLLSWPNDGWYQVQDAFSYREICSGVFSCDVSAGTYTVINHSSGKRFENIKVGGGQSQSSVQNDNSNTQDNGSAIVVQGNVISWPSDGWYQVQRSDNFQEVCAGVSSCKVSPGRYHVINHTNGKRYENVAVGLASSAMSLEEKLSLFEAQASHAADNALLAFNQRYSSGTLSNEQTNCVPDDLYGLSMVPVVNCDADQLVLEGGASVSRFTYEASSLASDRSFEDEASACRESLTNGDTDACSLGSVNLVENGLFIQYGTDARAYSDNRSIIISEDSLDVSGFALFGSFDDDACFLEVDADGQWRALKDSNAVICERRIDEALVVLGQ